MTRRDVSSAGASNTATADTVDRTREDEAEPRSIDTFLEKAYEDKHNGTKWRYWLLMFALGVGNSSDASEILCLSYILSDDEFLESIQGAAWKTGFLAAAVFFGMLLGGLVVGTLSDWVGRRPMVLFGLYCNAIAGILSALAVNIYAMIFFRMIAGIGIGATVPPLFTLATELAPPSQRGFFVTFCASFWMVGSLFVALVAIGILEHLDASWRVFAVVCAIPATLGGILVCATVPESPRFLALQGRHEDAVQAANLLALKMKYSGTLLTRQELSYYYPQNTIHPTLQDISASNPCVWFGKILVAANRDFWRSTSKLYVPHLRQTTLPLQTVWFTLCFGSYGIYVWINTLFEEVNLKDTYFNELLFAASNLPGNLISAYLMDRTGRTSLLIGSMLASAASLLSFAWFAVDFWQIGIVVSACAFQASAIAAWNTIDCMTSERFPTAVRSTGMGVCAASGRVGAMLAELVNANLVASPVRLLLVASTALVVGAITPCLLPDGDFTMRPLEDTVDGNARGREDPDEGRPMLDGGVPSTAATNGTAGDRKTPDASYQNMDDKNIV